METIRLPKLIPYFVGQLQQRLRFFQNHTFCHFITFIQAEKVGVIFEVCSQLRNNIQSYHNRKTTGGRCGSTGQIKNTAIERQIVDRMFHDIIATWAEAQISRVADLQANQRWCESWTFRFAVPLQQRYQETSIDIIMYFFFTSIK